MPLDDSIISREKDGSLNEDYCKWCYADGEYMYSNMDDLIEICAKNMVSAEHSEKEVREYLRSALPQLDYRKRYEQLSDGGEFERFKQTLIRIMMSDQRCRASAHLRIGDSETAQGNLCFMFRSA